MEPLLRDPHSHQSSYREKLLEHLFVGELLRHLWLRDITADLLNPQVDRGGYDLVMECRGIVRHVQLKASHREAMARGQKVQLELGRKPSGCVVWMLFERETLDLGPFLWFGGRPGDPLPDLTQFRIATHVKRNSEGVRTERPALRVVPKSSFTSLPDVGSVAKALFNVAP